MTRPVPTPLQDVHFLLLPEFSVMGFVSAIEPLRVANRFRPDSYRWHILSLDGGPVGGFGFADLKEPDGSQEERAQDCGKQPDLLRHGWDSNVPSPAGQWGSPMSRA